MQQGNYQGVAPSINVVLPDNLLNMTFSFSNLRLSQDGKTLQRINNTKSGYITVQLPPQHITEVAYPEDEHIKAPASAWISGSSYLVFEIPVADKAAIPFTLNGLMSWSRWPLRVVPVAQPPGGHEQAYLQPPQPNWLRSMFSSFIKEAHGAETRWAGSSSGARYIASEKFRMRSPVAVDMSLLRPNPQDPASEFDGARYTAIEAPHRLILSPVSGAGWLPSPTKGSGKWHELWHARLGTRVRAGNSYTVLESGDASAVRAVWSPDLRTKEGKPSSNDEDNRECETSKVCTPLNPGDRNQLVWQSSYLSWEETRPVWAKEFVLSSLGAWMDLNGRWDFEESARPAGITLWDHRSIMGRDHYVKIVEKGWLVPFGFRAVLTKIVERKPRVSAMGLVAALEQTVTLTIVEREIHYQFSGPQQERLNPLRYVALSGENRFEIDSGGSNVKLIRQGESAKIFNIRAIDLAGNELMLPASMAFVPLATLGSYFSAEDDADRANLEQKISDLTELKIRGDNQKFCFAGSDKESSSKLARTTFSARTLKFGIQKGVGGEGSSLEYRPILPRLEFADVLMDAASKMTGQQEYLKVKHHDSYISHGFETTGEKRNIGEVFAQAYNDGLQLKIPGANSGGVISPNMLISGLSRNFGAIGGDPETMSEFAKGIIPQDYFEHLFSNVELAKLVGGLTLKDVLDATGLESPFSGSSRALPTLHSTRGTVDGKPVITTLMEWETTSFKKNQGTFIANPNGKKSRLELDCRNVLFLDSSRAPDVVTRGKLTNFGINILGAVKVMFGGIVFSARGAEKPDFDVSDVSIEFLGPLKFIQTLQQYIPPNGFSDPPILDITSAGARVGYTMQLPEINSGAFLLENVGFSAAANLPFNGDPLALDLAFSTRDNPFRVTIYGIAGGGFVGVRLDTNIGVNMLEASLEAGGNLAIDLVVAQGKAYIMFGAYLRKEGGELTVAGYAKCGGSLEVLEIICVSVNFTLTLTYQESNNSLTGSGTLIVEVDVLCFSKDVALTYAVTLDGMEKQEQNTAGDIMRDRRTDTLLSDGRGYWDHYCAAYSCVDDRVLA